MKARSFAAALALAAAVTAAAAGPVRAGACVPAAPGNNPAFAEPGACPPKATNPAATKATAAAKPSTVRRENGRTVYTQGDTTIAVSGSVYGETVVGRGHMRP